MSLRHETTCSRRSDIQDVGDRTAQTFGEVIGKIVAEARHHIQLGLDPTRREVGVEVFHLVSCPILVAGKKISAKTATSCNLRSCRDIREVRVGRDDPN
jgi:hypothetical protein